MPCEGSHSSRIIGGCGRFDGISIILVDDLFVVDGWIVRCDLTSYVRRRTDTHAVPACLPIDQEEEIGVVCVIDESGV